MRETASVPVAVLPAVLTSAAVKPMTASLKTAVNMIVGILVGSSWVAALLIVTLGCVVSNITVIELDAGNGVPVALVAAAAGMLTCTKPLPVMPVTATLYDGPVPVTAAASVPPTVLPLKVTSVFVKPVAGALNVTVKLIGPALTGSP